MKTIADAIAATGIDVHDHLSRQAEIPLLAGFQRQGDIIVVPTPDATATTPVPAAGVPVVRGEAGGNTHALIADGPGVLCDLRAADIDDLTLAAVTIPEGSTAYLAHPEHGFNRLAPGAYTIRRQREQSDVIRLVED